jgi:hypothetical protein
MDSCPSLPKLISSCSMQQHIFSHIISIFVYISLNIVISSSTFNNILLIVCFNNKFSFNLPLFLRIMLVLNHIQKMYSVFITQLLLYILQNTLLDEFTNYKPCHKYHTGDQPATSCFTSNFLLVNG